MSAKNAKLIRAAEACKKYKIASSSLHSAVKNEILESVRDGDALFLDEQQVKEWSETRKRRKSGPRKPAEPKAAKSNGQSNTSKFISAFMKIYGELCKIENGLSGQAEQVITSIKQEILKTVREIEL